MTPFEPSQPEQPGMGPERSGPAGSGAAGSGVPGTLDVLVAEAAAAMARVVEAVMAAQPGALGMSVTGLDGDVDANLATLIELRTQIDAVITIAGTRVGDVGESWRGFAALLREQGKVADTEIRATRTAGMYVSEYPVLAGLWSSAQISGAQVRRIGRLASKLPVEDRERAVTLLAHYAPDLTEAELTSAARNLLNAVQPGWDERMIAREEQESFFTIFREGDGIGVRGHFAIEPGRWINTAVDAVTGVRASGDTRSKSQRQAEALVTIMRQYASSDVIPQLAMARPQFIVGIEWRDAMAMVNDAAPGDLPITQWGDRLDAATTRRMLSDADLTPVLFKAHDNDPQATSSDTDDAERTQSFAEVAFDAATADRLTTALHILTKRRKSKEFAKRYAPPVFLRLLTTPIEPIAVGRTTRTIEAPLRRAIMLRDLHCVVPGCDMPSHKCEIHHVKPWAKGGPTNIDNLATLCVRHHRTVENGTWQLRPRTPADGPGRYWVAEEKY